MKLFVLLLVSYIGLVLGDGIHHHGHASASFGGPSYHSSHQLSAAASYYPPPNYQHSNTYYYYHQPTYHVGKKYGKKAKLNAIFSPIKRLTGGLIALKGGLIKGHAAFWDSKGNALVNFGKVVAGRPPYGPEYIPDPRPVYVGNAYNNYDYYEPPSASLSGSFSASIGASLQNSYDSPEIYNPPVKTPYNRPVETTYNSPVQTTFNSPVETTFNSPAETTYNSPVVETSYNSPSSYNAPLQDSYGAPIADAYGPPSY